MYSFYNSSIGWHQVPESDFPENDTHEKYWCEKCDCETDMADLQFIGNIWMCPTCYREYLEEQEEENEV